MATIIFFCILILIYPVSTLLLEICNNLIGNLFDNGIEKLNEKFLRSVFEKLFKKLLRE